MRRKGTALLEILAPLVIGVIVIASVATLLSMLPHHTRKHVKIEKLKSGKYAFEDNFGGVDTWWYFDGGAATKNSNGTLSFPRGGTWVKGEKPEEELEEVDEANISENADGAVDADSTADSSSGSDGAGDSGGSDGGGDGGGDGGD